MKAPFLYLYIIYCVCLLATLPACKKGELVNTPQERAVKMEFKGAILNDTLEFVSNNKVIGEAINTWFKMTNVYYNPHEKIQLRKKADGKVVGEFEVMPVPFLQVKRIFYDGVTATDKLELTPVSDTNNMGFRLKFATTFKDFYGGPVDVEILHLHIDYNTFEFKFTPLKTISGVTTTFGEFFELPPLATVEDSYVFKVYKAGTKDLPYTSLKNVELSNPDFYYGDLVNTYYFVAGDSRLLSISPYISFNGDHDVVTDGYSVEDFSSAFK